MKKNKNGTFRAANTTKAISRLGWAITILDSREVIAVNDHWQPGEPWSVLIERHDTYWRVGVADHEDVWTYRNYKRPCPIDRVQIKNYRSQFVWQETIIRLTLDTVMRLWPTRVFDRWDFLIEMEKDTWREAMKLANERRRS